MTVPNALTIDVEEWFHVCGLPGEPAPLQGEERVVAAVERILSLLADCRARATFFVLGCVAEQHSALVPAIAAAGHEIASHGWSHRLVTGLTPAEFRDEVRRTGDLLERQTGRRPTGFRAPQWSLCRKRTPWAFPILREEGYRYDASLSPLPFVGNRRGPRGPHAIATPAGEIMEFPPLVTPTPFGNLPTGGGWGFRFFPERIIVATIGRLNRRGMPAVLFLHPREMDPAGPRLPLSPLRSFVAYGPRRSAEGRLRSLLGRFEFTTLAHLVDVWDTA
ncbi:polysaccharide deacetylase family protein [Geobacter sp.]|uniref:polysaccharide deacetylase family protein n=1 Tax=Geobacter sp. TaxID=46610 RepID=UPI0026149BEA|nr:polysaccharide deacetylase family protein [Geobacter sp.]